QGLRGQIFGGEVYGDVRVEFSPTLRYEMNGTASQIRLEEFGRHNLGPHAQINGLATAKLHLHGEGDSLEGLKGSGSLEVPKGQMYNLPLLVDLLKAFSLHPPDKTAFEEAYTKFRIQGPHVNIDSLDLYGNAISLGGKGTIDFDTNDVKKSEISLDF